MYRLLLKPRALAMTKAAYEWYEQQKSGLGDEFLTALDSIYEKVCSHPEYFNIARGFYRQARLQRFPFVVVYRISGKEIVVLAVFHTSQNPVMKFKE